MTCPHCGGTMLHTEACPEFRVMDAAVFVAECECGFPILVAWDCSVCGRPLHYDCGIRCNGQWFCSQCWSKLPEAK